LGLLDFLRSIYDWGWVILPFFLFVAWKNFWIEYIQKTYVAGADWITLELKIPHEVERTPKAMEQVFAGLHSIKKSANFKERYWDGKHQLHISMEIVGNAGAIHFFIRTPKSYQTLIESQIYSQYKDAEIEVVDDYAWNLPDSIPDEKYDLWGTELIFTKEDAYPIRTYRHFEEPLTEKKFIDPLSALAEVLGRLKAGEQIWIQYIIKPTLDERWQAEGKRLVDKLMGKEATASSSGIIEEIFQFFYDMVAVLWGEFAKETKKEEKKQPVIKQELSPGTKEIVGALEESISKHGFESGIRIIYIAKTDVFDIANIPAVLGAFKQFSTYHLNGFKPNSKVSPSVDYVFKKTREYIRKRKLYHAARFRFLVKKKLVLNTEELATIYHVPSKVLEVPMLPRIPAKKVEPPTELPSI